MTIDPRTRFPGLIRHNPGYSEARNQVQNMDIDGLLKLIDDLFGRDNLKYGDGVEAVRAEALRQLEIEWRAPNSDY